MENNEITLRQHWFTVSDLGRIEEAILAQLDAEEGSREVQANLERHEGALQVWRRF